MKFWYFYLPESCNNLFVQMKLKSGFIFLFAFCWNICFAQDSYLSPRIANYDMQVKLDVLEKKVTGHQTLLWNNPSADTIYELQYHLYYNAFKSSASTFMKGRDKFGILPESDDGCPWGWTDVQKIVDQYGNDLTGGMSYIQPDDGNRNDQTVLLVPLKVPVPPHGSIEIQLDWLSKVPNIMPRTGYNMEYYFMAQWFPKVGVYEPAGVRYAEQGQWNCHQYHSSGEYYSDFGVYKVDISVPKEYVVGASGIQTDEKINGDTKTYSFLAEDVIDFAWSASPHFVTQEMDWKGVSIKFLCYPDRTHFTNRYFSIMEKTMDFFEEKFEKYPYPSLTIIDPPYHGIFSSAMEYPMLFSAVSNCLLPTGVRSSEIIAIHEFTHQYFMQMVASHEQEEAWMDEGITNYYEARLMDLFYGEKTSTVDFMGIRVGNMESNRVDYFKLDNPSIAPNATNSWEFPGNSYHTIQYNKSALWLRTLQGLVGLETFDEIMKTYFLRWKFKHPSAKSFTDVVNEIVKKNHGDEFGDNMDWFFDQVLYGTSICDYGINSIGSNRVYSPMGYVDNFDNCIARGDTQKDSLYDSHFSVNRLGTMVMPLEILVQFEDGSSLIQKWNGVEARKEFHYLKTSRIECVEIDPERKIYIDKDFINNSITLKSQENAKRKYWTQFVNWVQNAMLSLSALI